MDVNATKLKILQIMSLALEISPPDESARTDDDPDVMVRYYANASSFSVDVYLKGWTSETKPDKSWSYILGTYKDGALRGDGDWIAGLDEIIDYLRGLNATVTAERRLLTNGIKRNQTEDQ